MQSHNITGPHTNLRGVLYCLFPSTMFLTYSLELECNSIKMIFCHFAASRGCWSLCLFQSFIPMFLLNYLFFDLYFRHTLPAVSTRNSLLILRSLFTCHPVKSVCLPRLPQYIFHLSCLTRVDICLANVFWLVRTLFLEVLSRSAVSP